MIVDTSPQRTEAWYRARAGCLTASNFHLFRASARLKTGANKGDFSGEARNVIFGAAIERISGYPLEIDEGFEVWQAKRGNALERHARLAHERMADLLCENAGFIKTDDGKFGATADAFADDLDGRRIGCEYKCFLAPEKLRSILLTGDPSTVIDQIDGGMWITGLTRWHFGLFCPALNSIGLGFTLHKIERNDDRIFELERDLVIADREVDATVLLLRQRAGLNTTPVPTTVEAAAEITTDLKQIAKTELPEDIFA